MPESVTAAGGVIRPTLLFHCTGDTVVPVGSSDAFAREHRAFVTYIRVPGDDHTKTWNVNPTPYDRAIARFLWRVRT